MARPNQIIENPMSGVTIIFQKTARETDGALLQMDVIIKPRGRGWLNDQHLHPRQAESLQLISGQMVYCIGGRYFSAAPGEPLSVAAGAHHFLYNGGQSDAHFIWEFRPALDMERLLETKFALAARGRLNAHGRPRFWQAIALANAYRDTERTTTVPWPLQRPLLALLAPLARVERAEEFLAV